MASPGESATADDSISTTSLRLSLAGLMTEQGSNAKATESSKTKAKEVGGSLPTTPTKLKDIDPAIISASKHSDGPYGQIGPGITHHKRTASSGSMVTVKAWKDPKPKSSQPEFDAVLAESKKSWDGVSDPFTQAPGTSIIFDSPDSPRKMSSEESIFRSPTPKPRQDRDNARISAENAQGYFKASLCIFVANLDAKSSDQDLEAAVYKSFSRFGELWVKIRRDRNTMPYAFCQYTKETDAAEALTHGHGIMILGRACRVELAKANRSVYVSRTAGGKITEAEAREIFAGEGPLEKVWYPTDTDKEVYRLAEGIWVTFTFFQDARDAQNNFKDSKEFRLEVPFSPEERERLRSPAYSSRAKSQRQSPTSIEHEINDLVERSKRAAMAGNTQAAIFVANLPENITVEALRECFETCGIIRTIEVAAKISDSGMKTYAFVQFSHGSGVWNAKTREMRIHGRLLRIEERGFYGRLVRRGLGRMNRMDSPREGPSTPYTPRAGHGSVRSPMTVPQSMTSVSEGTSYASTQPQTPVSHPFYNHGVSFGSPVASFGPFSGYYPPNQAEAGPGSISPYTAQQGMMSTYPLPGYAPSPWSPTGYNYPLLYSGPTPGDVAAPSGSGPADGQAAASFVDSGVAPLGASH